MSLLREIQSAAIDSKTDLATLLRKCKVLAARLGSAEFRTWVDNELSGYQSVDDLPAYRILRVYSRGDFSGPFGSGGGNIPIPLFNIPEEFREALSHSYIRESVASIEAHVETDEVREFWLPNLVALVGKDIYTNMNCVQAWKVIPITALIAVLDEIRNRILSFVLEIEAEDPEAGEAKINSNPVPPEKIQQIFNTHIDGSVQNVAIGSQSFEQHATNTTANAELFKQLIDALESIEDENLRTTLTSSVEEMRSAQGTTEFIDCYKKFISLLSDHMQVLGPIYPTVAQYLPALAEIVF